MLLLRANSATRERTMFPYLATMLTCLHSFVLLYQKRSTFVNAPRRRRGWPECARRECSHGGDECATAPPRLAWMHSTWMLGSRRAGLDPWWGLEPSSSCCSAPGSDPLERGPPTSLPPAKTAAERCTLRNAARRATQDVLSENAQAWSGSRSHSSCRLKRPRAAASSQQTGSWSMTGTQLVAVTVDVPVFRLGFAKWVAHSGCSSTRKSVSLRTLFDNLEYYFWSISVAEGNKMSANEPYYD